MTMPGRSACGLLLAGLVACGAETDGEGAATADTAAVRPAPEEARVEPAGVPLPPEFPADFPIPPRGVVTEAEVQPDADGVYSNVTILVPGDPGEEVDWLAGALADAGWVVTPAGAGLHAEQGESYVDLTAVPSDEFPGRVRIAAAIWKTTP